MEKTQTLSQRKRTAIINAALKEFREKGFRATSMDALSARASVSKRTVYNHFESKESLFKEIIRQLVEQTAEVMSFSYTPGRSLSSQLMEFATKQLRLFQTERFLDVSKIMVAECIYSPELAAQAFQQASKQEQGLAAWLQAAILDGRFKQIDPNYAMGQFLGLLKAHAFWPQLLMAAPLPAPAQCQQLAEDTVAMFLGFYEI